MTSKSLLVAGSVVALGLSNVSASNADCDVYAVQLHGNVSNSFGTQEFTIAEAGVLLQPGRRGNQVDFALLTQDDPNAEVPVGAIELMTNSAFARNPGMAAAAFDLAQVAVGNDAQFQLNSGMSYQMPQPNVFVALGPGASSGGLGGLCNLVNAPGLCEIGKASALQAAYMIPHAGGGILTGNAQAIAGTISVTGSSLDNANF